MGTEAGLLEISQEGDITFVGFSAKLAQLDETKLVDVSNSMQQVADQSAGQMVVLDLSRVEFFGSSFIEAMFRTWNRLNRKPGSKLVLCGLQEYCKEVVQITHLDRIWPVVANREEAKALQA